MMRLFIKMLMVTIDSSNNQTYNHNSWNASNYGDNADRIMIMIMIVIMIWILTIKLISITANVQMPIMIMIR